MRINRYLSKDLETAELVADHLLINTIEDSTDLLGNLYYQGFDAIIMYQKNINPDFFELKTKMAGEILQKFSNARMKLTIIGDFAEVDSKSLRDFIYESNKGSLVNFVNSLEEALK